MAAWTLTVRRRSTDADGTLRFEADLMDGGRKVATWLVSLTEARALQLLVRNEPGAAGLTAFEAWEV